MSNNLYHPRYWTTWFMLLILRLLSLLPFNIQLLLGRKLGHLGLRLLKRRRYIALTNLRLAFPNLSTQQIDQLLIHHFESLGMSIFESALGWWGSKKHLESMMHITGLEHLDSALKQGNGVILFSAHFTNVDLSGIMLATQRPIHAVIRPDSNPVVDQTIRRGRERYLLSTISRDNIRKMVKILKNNGVVEYAMDQNFGHRGSVFSKFFGIPAATNTATSRLVKMTSAAVIPFFTTRHDNGKVYKLTLQPPVEMDGSRVQYETDQLNQLIEKVVQKAPEQYLWIHRRFKDRPDNQQSYYQQRNA